MLLIECPYCKEARSELEFHYEGEAHIARPLDPDALTDEQWAEFLYVRTNTRGRHRERWRHVHGCGRFFNAVRDTVTDKLIVSYKQGERPEIADVERQPLT